VLRSDGSFVRDYLYVEDGAAAYMILAQALAEQKQLKGEAFNFSVERPLSVIDLTRMILQLMGSPLEPQILGNAPNEIPQQYLSAKKSREVLHWTPEFTLEEGLKKTIQWYTEFLSGS
jgi:CDP-glucose 4,6-dehydratase